MICGRPDLGERYLCGLVTMDRHGADPIVRVLAVVRYPRQHALYWPDVAIEIPPIEAGCICRLHLYGERRCGGYTSSERLTEATSLQGVSGPTSASLRSAPSPRRRLMNCLQAGLGRSEACCGGNGRKTVRLYAMSLAWAQREALERETGEAREIVLRQMAGEYRRQRAVVRLQKWEAAKYGA